jgi:uncharacterized protein (DUF58 family)
MRPTREGKRFLLATFLIGVAAFNTGNNLIYLILAMMLSILVISVVVLNLNMRRLALSVSVRQPVFAKETARMNIAITNNKRLLPSYSLRIKLPSGLKGEGYIAHVPASATAEGHADVHFQKRGAYSYGDFLVESSFPFIFFTKKLKTHVKGEIIVYPEIKETEGIPELSGNGISAYTTKPGHGEELLMIREFRYGDDVKLIHWKASAKSEKLMVKEFAAEMPKTASLILDDIKPFNADAFEKAVSFAASLAQRLINEGYFVRLITYSKVLPFGNGSEHLFKILDILAVIKESDTLEYPQIKDTGSVNILILKSGNSALKPLSASSDMVVYAETL